MNYRQAFEVADLAIQDRRQKGYEHPGGLAREMALAAVKAGENNKQQIDAMISVIASAEVSAFTFNHGAGI
jgi:hypothetical protein